MGLTKLLAPVFMALTLSMNNLESIIYEKIDEIYYMPWQSYWLEKTIKNIKREYHQFIDEASTKYNIDYNLLVSLIATESNGKICTTSGDGAKGLMQLMPGTARHYGLRIDEKIDERCSLASIDVGAKYYIFLKDVVYGNYTKNSLMALMAYNFGPGNVDNIFKDLRMCFDPYQNWDILTKYLTKETEDFVIRIYTRKYIAEQIKVDKYLKFVIRKTRRRANKNFIEYLSRIYNVPSTRIIKYNKHIKNFNRIPRGVKIYIPLGYKKFK